MSNKKKEGELPKLSNPFAQFKGLRGEIIPLDEEQEDNIVSIDPNVGSIGDNPVSIVNDEEEEVEDTENLEQGNKAIEENIKKAQELKKVKGKEKEITEEESESKEVDDNTEEDSEELPLKEFVDDLYNRNVIDFDSSDEDFDGKEDSVEKLISKTVKNRINKWAESLPPEFNDMLEYINNGGNPKDFMNIYFGNHSWEGFELSSDEAQKLAIREAELMSGTPADEIEEILSIYEHNGALEKRAKSALAKLQKHEATEKQELLEKQKAYVEKQKEASKREFENFKNDLMSRSDIMGFKLTPKLKEQLLDFLTIPDKRTGKTGYQKAVESNKDSSLLFALQAMNGFNLTTLEKEVQTKVTSNIAKIIRNQQNDSKSKIRSGKTQEHINENPFELFGSTKA